MTEPIIDLRQLCKEYPVQAGVVRALKGIDLQVSSGEFAAVLGKSGAGKTTLVNMISGIDRPTSGQLNVAGTAVHSLGESERATWRGRTVGVVFQSFQLVPTLKVLHNVMLPMDFAGRGSNREQKERAMFLLEQVGIADHAHKRPSSMSGGQQQRVAIARALANDPPLVLADEPTGSLDWVTSQEVLGVFEQMVSRGKTLLMVTHDPDIVRRATRTIHLIDGELVEHADQDGAVPRASCGRVSGECTSPEEEGAGIRSVQAEG